MSLGSMEQRTAGMKKQAQELIEQAYNRGYNAGYEDGKGQTWSEEVKKYEIEPDKKNEYIEQGRNEAWEAVKKLYLPVDDGGLPGDEIMKIFGELAWFRIVTKFSASEVVEKLHAYEEQKKQEEDKCIKVGDEVILSYDSCYGPNTKAIITAVDDSTEYLYNIMLSNGDTAWVTKTTVDRKTGRHFQELVEILKKLKEK